MSSVRGTFLLPVIAVVAIIGVGLSAVSLGTKPSTTSLTSQVKTLHEQLAAADNSIAKADKSIATLQSASAQAATTGNVSKLQTQLSALTLCVPQLSSEVGALNIQDNTQNGYMTSAYIQSPTIISSNCTKTLNGTGR
jgi:hypothetical protein